MSEKQFWLSNPRIINVWFEAYKEEENRKNELMHMWWGSYGVSAMTYSLSELLIPMFNGKKNSAKYIDEPIRIFPKTEEEKQLEYEIMTQAFMDWGDTIIKTYKKPDT